MVFRTEISPLPHTGLINHRSPVMLLGSCFSDNIGRRLKRELFPALVNPFGTLYNPCSIESTIRRIIDGTPFEESELFYHSGTYRHFLCHSALSSVSPETMLSGLNHRLHIAGDILHECNVLAITLGTAYVYTYNPTGQIVANCHKLPASMFTRSRLSVDEVASSLNDTVDMVRIINPSVKIIFTVSPIRHLADGAHDNQLSKATLLMAVDSVIESGQDMNIYLPAYELLIDDLRDYRFYASDMCHPTETAADYVYEYFARSFFNENTRALARRCSGLTGRISHRHMTDNPDIIASFNEATETIRRKLLSEHPYLELSFRLSHI